MADEHAISSPAMALVCPRCKQGLSRTETALVCDACDNTAYPIYGDERSPLYWLFAEPEAARYDWKARLNGYLDTTISTCNAQQRKAHNMAPGRTQERLLALARAARHNLEKVSAILEPLGLETLSFEGEAAPERRMLNKLPEHHGVDSYFVNLFRDWSWNNGEYLELRTVVQSLLKSAGAAPGTMATLGSGASRLPLDLHQLLQPDASYCIDLNPFLLLTAQRLAMGITENLVEIPALPRSDRCVVAQELYARAPLRDDAMQRFHWLAADVSQLPLADQSINTLITPWLIDIVAEPLPGLVARFNQLLQPGGLWVNTGPLSFLQHDAEHRYTQPEVEEIISACGFEIVESESRTVNYLCSPHSANGRVETVWSFAARKVHAIDTPADFNPLPVWLTEPNLAIPADPELPIDAARHLLNAQVLGTIDGSVSVDRLAALLAELHQLSQTEARNIVRRILLERRAP